MTGAEHVPAFARPISVGQSLLGVTIYASADSLGGVSQLLLAVVAVSTPDQQSTRLGG
jgi:hypothetical protein